MNSIYNKIFTFWIIISALMTTAVHAQAVKLIKEYNRDSIYLGLENQLIVPLHFSLNVKDSFPKSILSQTSIAIPPKKTIMPIVRLPMELVPDTSNLKLTDYINITNGRMGKAYDRAPDLDYKYSLPFPKHRAYKLIQGFNGNFTHRKSNYSKYALDFNLSIGDTVTAARGGIVVMFEYQYKKAGGPEMINKVNELFILHDDGSLGYYGHLDYQGVLVEQEQRVQEGDPIAISGFTGYARGPHLHFVVLTENNQSIPIKIKGYRKLKEDRVYRHK